MSEEHLTNKLKDLFRYWDTLERDQSLQLKLEYIDDDYNIFVYHSKAREIIAQLNNIFNTAVNFTNSNRINGNLETYSSIIGLSIVGETGAGKSAIIKEFIRLKAQEKLKFLNTPQYYEQQHIVWINLPPKDHGIKGLYQAVLKPFFKDPDLLSAQAKDIKYLSAKDVKGLLQEQVGTFLKNGNTMILFIDEFQNLWDSRKSRINTDILEALKLLGLNGWCAIVPSGIPESINAINADEQLSQRCPIFEFSELSYFKYDYEFIDFINGFEEQLPFKERSNLALDENGEQSDLSWIIFEKASKSFRSRENKDPKTWFTNARFISYVILESAKRALKSGSEKILQEHIEAVPVPKNKKLN